MASRLRHQLWEAVVSGQGPVLPHLVGAILAAGRFAERAFGNTERHG